MSTLKEKVDIVNMIYGLILESNLHKEDILSEVDMSDPYLERSIAFVKQLNTKTKANLNKSRFIYAQQVLEDLINKAGNNIDTFFEGLLSESESKEIVAFFRNYKSISDTEKKAILIDNKVLEIISKVKSNLDRSTE